jgi:cellulose synthase/poly-beta-1,6-N-acetylglucosamine synthase-like glycosyltransferase
MTPVSAIVLIAYFTALLFVLLFSIFQFHLAWKYRRYKKYIPPDTLSINNYPFVTIQLPVYNEMYVIERLIQATAAIDYPKDRFEIQILDDSTDETTAIAADICKQLKNNGIDIQHIQREIREGFKAGALAYGLAKAKGEYVAIFDADFLPPENFLKQTVPHFENKNTGMVQTRWGHLNKQYSLLTRIQAFGLDAHFTVEQKSRNHAGYFMNFNGTAGIWRKSTIIDAGGWLADTLTEDLDLSYRAQLKGWDFVYLEDVVSPAELPAEITSLKSQQFRWNKGASQNAVKNLPKVFKSDASLIKKLHAFFHLNNSAVFVCIIIALLCSIPLLYIKSSFTNGNMVFSWAVVSLSGFLFLGFFYYIPFVSVNRRLHSNPLMFVLWFPLFLSVSMGMALHNTFAVVEGWLGIKSSFIRTPKYNLSDKSGSWHKKKYFKPRWNLINLGELLVIIYSIYGIVIGIRLGDTGLVPFHLMMATGTSIILGYSLLHSIIKE